MYGNDKTWQHLTAAGAYSGQQWLMSTKRDRTLRFANAYSGDDVFLAARTKADGAVGLVVEAAEEGSRQQTWILCPVFRIRE